MKQRKYMKFGSLLALFIMMIGVIVMVNKHSAHNESVEGNRELKLSQVSSYYELFFENKLKVLDDIAGDQMILNYFKEIKVPDELETHHNYDKVLKTIIDKKESIEDVGHLYISSNHVRSILSEPPFEMPNGYIPSEREWFMKALTSDDVQVGSVYVDAFTNDPYLTLSRVIKDTEARGVVGMDVNMAKIIHYIDEQGSVILADDQFVIGLSENLKKDFNTSSLEKLFGEPLEEDGTYDVTYRGYDLTVQVLSEDFTGHKILVLNDNAVSNRLIVSSLVQTFVVSLMLSGLVIIVSIKADRRALKIKIDDMS